MGKYLPQFNAFNPDPRPGSYYVSAVSDRSHWLMAGPYPTHAAALADVARARQISCDADPRGHWLGWGTCRVEGETKPGILNQEGMM